MKHLALAIALSLSWPSFAVDRSTSPSFTFIRSDWKGRIQVVIDGDDRAFYTVYVFQPMSKLPPLAAATYRAVVTKSPGRLRIDSEEPPLHLDLYLPTEPEEPKLEGELPSLKANGFAIREFKVSRAVGAMDEVTSDDLPSLVGAADSMALKREEGRVVKDLDCQTGGVGSLYAAGYKCPGRRPGPALTSWMGSAGEAWTLECSSEYYGCGFCSFPPGPASAIQQCRPYVPSKEKKPR